MQPRGNVTATYLVDLKFQLTKILSFRRAVWIWIVIQGHHNIYCQVSSWVSSLQLYHFATQLEWLLYDVNRPHFSHFISVPCSWMASYAAQVWVEFSREVSDQNCTTWSSITTSLHPFWNHKFSFYLRFFSLYKCFVDPAVSLFVESCKSCFFIFLQFDLFL